MCLSLYVGLELKEKHKNFASRKNSVIRYKKYHLQLQ